MTDTSSTKQLEEIELFTNPPPTSWGQDDDPEEPWNDDYYDVVMD